MARQRTLRTMARRCAEYVQWALPEGGSLPQDAWQQRHRVILWLLWLHAAGIAAFGLISGLGLSHSMLETAALVPWGVAASATGWGRRVRACAASLGLLTASAVLVHFANGAIEAHFHFFVMIAVIAFYQDWRPFLLAFGFVVLQHGLGGVLVPSMVYDHADAWADPWKWAAIHGGFVLAASAAYVAHWRLSELTQAERHGTQQTQSRLAAIVTSSEDAIVSTDAAGRIAIWNAAAERLYGYTAAEIVGQSLAILVPPEQQAEVRAIAERLHQGKRIEGVETKALRKDGTRLDVSVSVSHIRDASGAQVGTAVIVRNISERIRVQEELRAQIAERERVEVGLRESEERYRQMFEKNQAIKLLIDPISGGIVDANGAAAEFYGYPRAELLRRRIAEINTLAPDELAAEMARAAGEQRSYFLFRHRLASGEVRDVEVHSSPVDVGGQRLLYSIIHDITDRRRAEAALHFQKSLLEAQGEASPDGILAVSPDGRILSSNRRFAELWRLPEAILATRSDEAALAAVLDQLTDPQEFLGRVADLYAHPEESSHEEIALKDGRTFDRYSAPVHHADGTSYGRVWFFRDITAYKRAEGALRHQALHDQLTELPNRTLLHDRLEQATLVAQRERSSLALLIMDLDRFKEINDTFGHHCGDLLLQEAGQRLRWSLRASDTVARLGGDEFAVLLPAADAADAIRIAEQLRQAIERPFTLEDQRLEVGASVGIALYPQHGADPDTLLRRADVAMYGAKRAGGGAAVYAAELDQHTPDRLALIGELRQAIEQDQLTLHFQPKVDLTGGLVGVEALARWEHSQRGFVPPDQFIPLAEHTGLIKPLTRWVIDAALRQCRAWQLGGSEIQVAVNVSMRDLHDAGFPDTIAELLTTRGVAARCLRIEITEGAIMADPTRALDVLMRLRELGVRTAVDDFGTGYASLAYLKRLPVDELKIDRSFVRHVAEDEDDAAIVRSTIGLGHDLGLVVVAEGVEDQAAWDLLDRFGCDVVQGYFVSRPLPAAALAHWLHESTPGTDQLKAA